MGQQLRCKSAGQNPKISAKMIKRPTPDQADENPGFWGSLFGGNPPTNLPKPSQVPKEKEEVEINAVELLDLSKGANEEGDTEKSDLVVDIQEDAAKKAVSKPRPTISLKRSRREATDWDKYIAYKDLLMCLWYRRLKFSSGATGVAFTSYFANILMLMLCWFVRDQVSGATGELEGSANSFFGLARC